MSSQAHEMERLQALRSYDILDTPAEATFDRITRIALSIIEVPICLISLVDAHRQWFKSRQGFDVTESPRDTAFCSHAIMQDDVMVVSDSLDDPRFANNPLVRGEPNIRFYAGAPLKTPTGYKIGTLCVVDRIPRQLTVTQIDCLQGLAQLAVDQMELRLAGRKALHEFESKQETLRNFNAVLSGVDNGVMLLGWDLRVQLVNPEFCRMFQISNAAAADHPTFLEIANHLRRIAIADMPDAHWNAFIQLQEDGPGQSEQLIHEWQLFDGRTLEQKCIATAAGGRLLTYRDITGRKEADRLKNEQLASTSHELQALQSELARVAKLTTVREMAGSIAHEINQPLAAIVANANAGLRWLGKSTPDLTEASAALNCIINDGHRASQAIGSIWSHLKKGATEAAPVDINALIKEVLMVLRSELESHAVSVKVDLDDGLPPVMAVHSQLQQVIINLCLNAAEAMSSMSERARLLWVRSERCGSSNVIIYVEDNGPGIDPLTMNMMFRSFFTTKHQGIGLGLSACRSIIEAHGGKLVATNGPVHGAIFEVSVPIAGERSFPLANQGWSKRCRM